ncbi:MAG: hypothetical protein ACHQ03_10795 [Candidatus Bathyarchaeia archaeon]
MKPKWRIKYNRIGVKLRRIRYDMWMAFVGGIMGGAVVLSLNKMLTDLETRNLQDALVNEVGLIAIIAALALITLIFVPDNNH